MKKSNFMSVVSVLALCALGSVPVFAQTTGEGDSAAESPSVGDIVVTATRQSTLLSKTPITMTAIGGDSLRNAGITDPRSLSAAVPSLALTESGDAVRISIRGVTSTDTTEKGDPSVAFLLDGIYIARPTDVMGSFYDTERVEVLRGPQGTLYGRNTTAGVINVISARPTDKLQASLDGSYGNLDTVDVTGMVNVPVAEGLGLRAAVNYQRQNPYYTVNGGATVPLDPYRDVLSGRLSFGGKIGDNLTFVIRGDYSKIKGTGTSGNVVTLDRFFPGALTPTVDPVYVDSSSANQRTLTIAPTYPNRRDNEAYGISGEFTYDFGPVQLTYLGAYRKSDRNELRDFLLLSALNNPVIYFGTFKQDSHELRLAFGSGSRFHGQVGGYYFHEKSSVEFNFGAPLSTFIDPLAPNATGFAFPQGPTIARSKAAFGQLTYDITPDLHVTAGVRYTNDFKSRNGATVLDFPDAAAAAAYQTALAAAGRDVVPCSAARCTLNQNIAAKTYNKTIYKFGVDYDAPGLGLIYASVSSGYKAGGFNDGCITGQGIGCNLTEAALYYNPETLTDYEAGIKFRISSEFRLNAAVFHYDYGSLQVSQIVTVPLPVTLIRNAAKAKVDGVEIEAQMQPSDNDKFDVGYTYTNARYTQFTPDPTNYPDFSFAGRPLDHAPKHVVTASYVHTFPLGNGGKIDLSAQTKLSSAYYMIDLTNLSQFRQPSFTKTDLTATYTAPDDRYYVQGFVKNLEDSITLGAAQSGLNAYAIIEAPRTYGIRAGVKF